MNRLTIIAAGLGSAALLSLAIAADAQHDHGHPTVKEGAAADIQPDERVALGLSRSAEAGLKLTMREHLDALHAIMAALSRQDFEQAAKVAHEELGFPKHHQAMQREVGATFPPKYHELAMAHHQEAEGLAKVIPTKDLKAILPALERTIGACVACHRVYRLDRTNPSD
jgi:hypothetical protein